MFQGSFIDRGIEMPEDVIDSENPDYVMQRIRELYLADSTVDSGYASVHSYPTFWWQLERIVDHAFASRTAFSALIQNPRDRYRYNRQCP
jgi:hypothetical protein